MPEPTPEQIGREAGEAIANAIADNLEAVLLRMADSIARVQAEQAELRDELLRLSERVDAAMYDTTPGTGPVHATPKLLGGE